MNRLTKRPVFRRPRRRGFTLILVTVMLTIFIGVAAWVVDFGRMYLFRTQLHTAADGAVLAAAFEIMRLQPCSSDCFSATDSARSYAARHRVDTVPVSLVHADMVPGTWTRAGGFVPVAGGNWNDGSIDAVRVTVRYNAQYGVFGRFLGGTSHVVTASADAAVGFVGATTCVRPVAIPYQALLDQLFGVGVKNPSYNLTADDVIALRSAGIANEVQLKLGTDATSGNFYILQMGPYRYANGTLGSPPPSFSGSTYPNMFGGSCDNSPWTIGPGDWLQGKQGNASGPAQKGFETLCGVSISGNGIWTCPVPLANRTVKVAMWATEDDGVCTPRCFQVKYAGVFVVTKYVSTPGGDDDGIYGYFTAMPSDGTFSGTASPLQMIALVK